MKNQNRLLIIGTIPPPIGGVTVHVSRLISHLDKVGFLYGFVDYKKNGILKILKKIKKYNIIHIHVSNIFFVLFIVIYTKILSKKIIFSMHYDVNIMKSFLKNKIFKFCLKTIDVPIALNESSLSFSLKINKNAMRISSFLPPLKEESLPPILLKNIEYDKKIYKKLFTTNAWKLVFDEQNNEVYGVFSLIKIFQKLPNYKLYISNSSGDYEKYVKDNEIEIPKNIQFISFSHSFFEVIKFCDGVIRNTTTDGDAISVKEALYLDKKVFATNVVSRPKGVFCYNNINELENMLNDFDNLKIIEKEKDLNGFPIIINLYKSFIKI